METAQIEKLTGTKVDRADRLNKEKTLYDASPGEIFWKNFLAGLGRSLGGMIIYALFVSVVGGLALKLLMPVIVPMFGQLQNVYGSLNRVR